MARRARRPVPRREAARPSAGARRDLAWIAGAALAYKAIYLAWYVRAVPFFTQPISDSREYLEWARSIASGDWLGRAQGVFYQAPLYPYLVSLGVALGLGDSIWIPIFQILLGTAVVCLVYALGRALFSRAAGIAGAGLALAYGPLSFYETKIGTEPLANALLLASLACTQLAPGLSRSAAAGALAGLATLARANLAVAFPVYLAAIALDRRASRRARLGRAAILALAGTLVVLPVTLRNAWVGGDWVLISANAGLTFYHGNNGNAVGSFAPPPELRAHGIAEQRALQHTVAERIAGRPLTPSETSAFWLRRGLEHIARDPLEWLEQTQIPKLWLLASSYEIGDTYSLELERRQVVWLWLAPLPFGALIGLALLGALSARGRWRGLLPLLGVALGVLATNLVFYVSSRYRLPAAAPLAVLAGQGALVAVDWLRRAPRLWRSESLVLALAASVLLASFVHPWSADVRRRMQADFAVNEAAAFALGERYADAIVRYRAALDLHGEHAEAWLGLGLALELQGQQQEAARAYRHHLALRPQSPVGLVALADLEAALGNAAEAAALRERAGSLAGP